MNNDKICYQHHTKTLELEFLLLGPAIVGVLSQSLGHLEVRPCQSHVADVCRLRCVITLGVQS